MSATFEPGTVAVATFCGRPNVRVMRYDTGAEAGWVTYDLGATWQDDRHVTDVRPLVVLDLSPHEVMRALEALRGSRGMVAMQVADKLEEAARPPKPPEPTGLGAVVEDGRGIRWTRVETAAQARSRNPWYPSDCEDQPAEWDEITAVRVLSEGVR